MTNSLAKHRDQMWTDTGKPGAAASLRRKCRSAPDHGQDRSACDGRARIEVSHATSGCLRGPSLFIRTAGGRCIGNQPRRADAILLPASARRKFLRAVMAARRQLVSQPRRQAIADLTHHRLSQVRGFNTTELREARTQNAGIPFQGRA